MENETIKYNDNYINYEGINLDINIIYIINKIKIVPINDLMIILNYRNKFNIDKFVFNNNKYFYELIKINKLIVGIEGTEIEETFPKNHESIYSTLIQYEKDIKIENKTLHEINPVFCLLLIEKNNIDNLNEQEISLYLFTLQYYNYLLKSYEKYKWVDNLFAIVKYDDKCFMYSLKITKRQMEEFCNKCKSFKYDFEDIVVEKCSLDTNGQKTIIKYLGFGVFDIFNHKIFKK